MPKTLGVSKAGVLHHFKSKQALLKALISRDYERFAASLNAHRAALDAGAKDLNQAQRELLAYFRAALDDAEGGDLLRISLSLAAMINPSLIDEDSVDLADRWSDVDETDEDALALATARLVADGLWINTILGFAPSEKLTKTLQVRLVAALE